VPRSSIAPIEVAKDDAGGTMSTPIEVASLRAYVFEVDR